MAAMENLTMENGKKEIIEHSRTGFGIDISKACSSREALKMASLDWTVETRKTFYLDGDNFVEVPNVFQNVRLADGKSLGTVTGRYKICQNSDAFEFTDELLGENVKFCRAGSFYGGRSVWLSAEMPEDKIILGDPVKQTLVFLNTHDGSGAVRVLIAPKRIICSNALNLFIASASRKWSCVHTGMVQYKMDEARQTLLRAEQYMDALEQTCEALQAQKLTGRDVSDLIEQLLPFTSDSKISMERVTQRRAELLDLYQNKYDLTHFGDTAYRFVNAVSDFATHAEPFRRTGSYEERLFEKTINGHPMIDKAFSLVA